MKKSLIFWLAAVTCAAWILVGCESPTDGAAGAAGAPGKTIVPVSGAVTADLFQAVIDASDGIIAGDVTITGTSPIVLPSNKTLQLVGAIILPDDGVFVVVSADSLSGNGGFVGTASGNASYLIAPPAVTAARNGGTDLTSVPLQAFGDGFDNGASVLGVQGDLAITDAAGATKIAGKTVYVTGNVTVSNAASPTAIAALGNVNVSAAVTGDVSAQGNVTASAVITGAVAAKGNVTFTTTAQNALTGLDAGSVESAVAITTTSDGDITVDGELKTTGTSSHVTLGGTGELTAGSLNLTGNLAVGTATTGAVTVNGAAIIGGTLTNGAAASVFTFNGATTVTGAFTPGNAGTVIGGTGAVTLTAPPVITNGLTVTNTTGVTIPSVTGVPSKSIDASAGKVIFGTDNDSVTITKGTLASGADTALASAAANGAVTLVNGASLVLADEGSIVVAGDGSVALPNSKFGAGTYTAAGQVTITAKTAGDEIATAATGDKGLIIGAANTALSLLTSTTTTATYTLKNATTGRGVVFGNGASAITVGNGTTSDTSSLEAPATAKIVLGTSGNTTDAIGLGNASKLVLATGATIGVFTNNPGTLAASDTTDAIGGAVLSGASSSLTNSTGTLTTTTAEATLTGASSGDSSIAAGATFTGVT